MDRRVALIEKRQPDGSMKKEAVSVITRTEKEKIEVARKICDLFSLGMYTIASICKKFEVNVQQFNKWACISEDITTMVIKGQDIPKGCIPAVHEMYKSAVSRASKAYKFELKEKAKRALLSRVEGTDYEETVEEEEIDKDRFLPDGEPNPNYKKMIVVKRRVKKGRHAPDTTAIVFALTNMDSENFKNRNDQTMTHRLDKDPLEDLSDDDITRKRRESELRLKKLIDNGEGSNTEYVEIDSE